MNDAAPTTVKLLAAAFAVAGPLVAMAPRGAWVLALVAAIATVASERIAGRGWALPSARALLLTGMFALWCAASIIWSLDPALSAAKLRDLAGMMLAALALIGVTSRLSDPQRNVVAKAMIGGTIVGLILIGIETAFDFPIYRAVIGPSPKLTDLLESKRAVDALPLLVWPAALALQRLGKPLFGIALAVVWTLVSFRLTAASATVAMVLSLIVLALSYLSVDRTRQLLVLGTVLGFVLILPVGLLLYEKGGDYTATLKNSARHRIEIWHFAAARTLDHTMLGYGLETSRVIPNNGAQSAFQEKDNPIIPLHPHDAFLQIWLELGAVGAALAGNLLVAMLGALRDWPKGGARFTLATYAAALTVAGLAFGIWQTWWMATLVIGIVACAAIAPGDSQAAEPAMIKRRAANG